LQKILNKDGNVLITSSGLSLNGKRDLIQMYCSMFYNEKNNFYVNEMNEDATLCTIAMNKIENSISKVVEKHLVKIIYEEKFSEEFKKLTEDGKIVVKASRDYNKEDLIRNHCYAFSNERVSFMVNDISEDCTTCTVQMNLQDEYYHTTSIEKHVIKISYDKNMSEDFKKKLNKDGKFVINSVKPTSEEQWGSTFEVLFMGNNQGTYADYVAEDFSSCELTLRDSNGIPETHKVEIVYNYDEAIKKEADQIMKNFPEDREYFMVKDMELVNYWLHSGDESDKYGASNFDNYSGELKSFVNHKNFNLLVDHRAGADDEFFTMRAGIGLLQHEGISYYVKQHVGVLGNHIIYVPDDTPSTKEALAAAVQKRVDEYAGTGKVKISAGEGTILEYYENYSGKKIKELQKKIDTEKSKSQPDQFLIAQYEMQIDWYKEYYNNNYFLGSYNDPEGEHYFLQNAEGDYWFIATINGVEYEFIVVKDSDNMISPTYKTADLNTNIEITSASTSVPLDTTIKAEKLTSGTEYEKIMKILKVADNETFDLKLYSNSLNEYITKLDDGRFEVKIPISKELKAKDLSVYYVDEKENITEHEVTVKDDYAIFTTNHFSIYTLAEKIKDIPKQEDVIEENSEKGEKDETPNTGIEEKTTNYILLITILLAIGIAVLRKK